MELQARMQQQRRCCNAAQGVLWHCRLQRLRTSRSCSCVLDAPPSSWLTSAPTAFEGPEPSEPVHMSLPVTSVRSAMVVCSLLVRAAAQAQVGSAHTRRVRRVVQ